MVAKRHRFGFFHPELLIAALLIILVGAVLYFTTTRTNLPQLVSLSTPVPETTSDINDWETYTQLSGVRFKYLQNLIPQVESGVVEFSEGEEVVLSVYEISDESTYAMGISYCEAHPEDESCERYEEDGKYIAIDWMKDSEVVAKAKI